MSRWAEYLALVSSQIPGASPGYVMDELPMCRGNQLKTLAMERGGVKMYERGSQGLSLAEQFHTALGA